MKTKPILFSTEMVQAILQGKKSMTRRVMKILPRISSNIDRCGELINEYELYHLCPYGKVGDVLWVKETYQKIEGNRLIYKADPIIWGGKWKSSLFMPKEAARLFLKITCVRLERLKYISLEDAKAEGVRVPVNNRGTKDQRVVIELTEKYNALYFLPHGTLKGDYKPSPKEWVVAHFYSLWTKINGIGWWDTNPWVWVISFERCEKPENFTT